MTIRLTRSAVSISALIIVLMLAVTPSFADNTILYTNGPIKGTENPYSITGGDAVSDSFTLSNPSTISSFSAGLWVLPGDSPAGLSWAILSASGDPFSGTPLASGSASLTAHNFSNSPAGFGFDRYPIFTSTVSGLSVNLPAGSYYLVLYNGTAASLPNLYWDENDGLSTAFSKGTGAVGSEAFTIYGPTSVTPEPGTMLMFGTGALGLFGAFRRRFCL